MAGDECPSVDLVNRYLDFAEHAGIPVALGDFDSLLNKLGIKKGSEEHFSLVWSDLARKGRNNDPAALDELKKAHPGWAEKIERMAHLESVLNVAFQSTRIRLSELVGQLGLQIEEKLKTSRAIDTYVVSRLPGSPRFSTFTESERFVIKAGFGPVALKLLKREFLAGRSLDPSLFIRPVTLEAKEDITWVSLDYASGGSLERSPRLELGEIWHAWKQMAKALASMHEKLLCHNDIKASNIMISTSGISRTYRIGDLQLVTREGKPIPRYPDIWDHPDWEPGQLARRRDDIYRLGMTIAWMIDSRIASPEFGPNEKRLSLVGAMPAPFAEPLRLCLNDDPLDRIDNGTELHRVLKGSKAYMYLENPTSNKGK